MIKCSFAACLHGTYADVEGLSACLTCPPGYFCLNETSNFLVNSCPKGHYCPAGTKEPYQFKCPPGTFNDKVGMQNDSACLPCEGGKYCEGFGNSRPTNSCDPGWYCPSKADNARFRRCQPRFYCPTGSAKMQPCLSGMFCDTPELAYPRDQCDAGYYCPNGSISRTEVDCPRGYYCGKGTSMPEACQPGTYQPILRAQSVSQCVNCTAGFYCNNTALSSPDGQCGNGYYCPSGQSLQYPPAFICPEGHYCQIGYSLPRRCENGTYQDNTGMASCKACLAGYYCDNTVTAVTTLTGRECPPGSYCPTRTRYAREFGCQPGTWSNRTGLVNPSQCDACPPR